MANKRFVFFVAMWITYVTIVLTSTAVATWQVWCSCLPWHAAAALAQVLAPLLHIFFTITSNHLVRAMRLARLSAQHAAAAQLLPFQERVSTQPPATIG